MSSRDKARILLESDKSVYKLENGDIVHSTSFISYKCRHLKHLLNTLEGAKRIVTLGNTTIDIRMDNIDEHIIKEKTCTSTGGTDAGHACGSTSWCNTNCNAPIPNCPEKCCKCSPTPPTQPPPPTPPPPPTVIQNQYTKAAHFISRDLKKYLNESDASLGTFISAPTPAPKITVYLMLDSYDKYNGMMELITKNNNNLPIDRIIIGFFRPDYDYSPYIKNLDKPFTEITVGLWGSTPDDITTQSITFRDFIEFIKLIKTCTGPTTGKPIQVYLSMGGWNYNCFPKFAQNSHSHKNADYWDPTLSKTTNMFLNVCSPASKTTTMDSYTFFPDPASNLTSDEIKDLSENDIYQGWSIRLTPGKKVDQLSIPKWQWPIISEQSENTTFKNVKNSDCSDNTNTCKTVDEANNNFGYIPEDYRVSITANEVVGLTNTPLGVKTYDTFVKFAALAGADGVDLDYEEAWHADTFKCANCGPSVTKASLWKSNHGPYMFTQTKGKFARIVAVLKKALQNHLKKDGTKLLLSMPGPAVGANETRYGNTSWYGGNFKGLLLNDERCGPLATGTCDSPTVKWFEWYKVFMALGMPDYSKTMSGNNFSGWNEIFDGGYFPMVYDLGGGALKDPTHLTDDSATTANYECGPLDPSHVRAPGVSPKKCDLISQLKFYTDQFINKGMHIGIGFEVGMPNYPRVDEKSWKQNDPATQQDYLILPMTESFNSSKLSNPLNFYHSTNFGSRNVQYKYGTFYWEMFKNIPTNGNFSCVKCTFNTTTDLSDASCSIVPKAIPLGQLVTKMCTWANGTPAACSWGTHPDKISNAPYDMSRDCVPKNWG